MPDGFCDGLTVSNVNNFESIKEFGIGKVRLPSFKSNSEWFKPRFESSKPVDEIYKICFDLVAAKQFGKAIDIMLNEVYEYSKLLAKKFGKTFDDKADIPNLLQELKQDGIMTEDDWNRLTVLQMVLDGVDVEVYEYGGQIGSEEVRYALEYLEVVKSIMSKHRVHIGFSAESISHFDRIVSQATPTPPAKTFYTTVVRVFLGCTPRGTVTNRFNKNESSNAFTTFLLS